MRRALSEFAAFAGPLTACATAPGKVASGAASTAAECKNERRFTVLPFTIFLSRSAAFQFEYLLRRTLKIALETTILVNIEGLVLFFRQFLRHLV
jgi:hypothetical protein